MDTERQSNTNAPVYSGFDSGCSGVSSGDTDWFFSAVTRGQTEIVAQALSDGVSADVRDRAGTPALIVAISAPQYRSLSVQNADMIDLLLAKGANTGIRDKQGRSAARAFLRTGALSNPIDWERAPALAIFRLLLTPALEINQPEDNGRSLLQEALDADADPTALDILFACGADAEFADVNELRAVHRPWRESNLWKLTNLVSNGANIDSRDVSGASALSYAKDAHAVNEMLALGADLNHLDNQGRNALAIMLDSPNDTGFILSANMSLVAAGIDTAQFDQTGRSVDSRLAASTSPRFARLRALIASKRVRAAMTPDS